MNMPPVVILTKSSAEKNLLRSSNIGANCYTTRPVGLGEFTKLIKALDDHWFTVVNLPRRTHHGQ